MRCFLAAIFMALVVTLAGCGGGGGDTTGGGADTTRPTAAPTETRTVTEQPPATVTEEAPAPATTTVPPPGEVAPKGPAEGCLYTLGQPEIQAGSSGPAVRKAQCYLNLSLSGAPIPEDGDFGPVTDEATRRFQGCAGITVDGLIGAQTWSHLVYWANSPSYVC